MSPYSLASLACVAQSADPYAGNGTTTLYADNITTVRQGLTLVHFSAQLEPCLTHINTLHNLNTP
jgi:hypothetical protein